MASITFYQPMVEFSCRSDHIRISDQFTFFVRLANIQRWFLHVESGFDLPNILLTYGRVFGIFEHFHIFD